MIIPAFYGILPYPLLRPSICDTIEACVRIQVMFARYNWTIGGNPVYGLPVRKRQSPRPVGT